MHRKAIGKLKTTIKEYSVGKLTSIPRLEVLDLMITEKQESEKGKNVVLIFSKSKNDTTKAHCFFYEQLTRIKISRVLKYLNFTRLCRKTELTDLIIIYH